LLAVPVKDAIRAVVSDPTASAGSEVRAAYQIARLIRNAFAHAPFSPIWSIRIPLGGEHCLVPKDQE
jgi:hypothetical protein